MKICVLTANFNCDPGRVWLYLTKPTFNNWRTDITAVEPSTDGMSETQTHTDGSITQVVFTRKEKGRAMSCDFVHGRQKGHFTAILFGGATTSLECTFEIDGIGLFDKAHKHLQPVLDMLQAVADRAS